jgi:hypothetical protein
MLSYSLTWTLNFFITSYLLPLFLYTAQQFMDMTGDVATLAVVIADLGENGETKFLGAPANFGPPLTEIPLGMIFLTFSFP